MHLESLVVLQGYLLEQPSSNKCLQVLENSNICENLLTLRYKQFSIKVHSFPFISRVLDFRATNHADNLVWLSRKSHVMITFTWCKHCSMALRYNNDINVQTQEKNKQFLLTECWLLCGTATSWKYTLRAAYENSKEPTLILELLTMGKQKKYDKFLKDTCAELWV